MRAVSGCGAVKAKLTLHERTYRCDGCGLAIDRDTNAAINLARLSELTRWQRVRELPARPVAL